MLQKTPEKKIRLSTLVEEGSMRSRNRRND